MELFEIASVLGGIFLIIGAWYLYRGDAFKSVIAYFFADLCWLTMAFINESYFGTFSIIIGIILSLGVWIKMNNGVFVKNLRKN